MDGAGGGGSFTRVVVGDIKPDILAQIARDEGGRQLCRRAPAAPSSLVSQCRGYHVHAESSQGARLPALVPEHQQRLVFGVH